MKREYTDVGLLTKDMLLMALDETDNKYAMIIPVKEMPETASAPATQEKTVLSDHKITYIEGLQSSEQKEYTFNYHRDNINALKQFAGKQVSFLERNPDNTGERFKGTLNFGRNGVSPNGVEEGRIFITVNDADEFPIEDVRDIIKPTAIITSALNDVELVGTASKTITLETSPLATVAAVSDSSSIATAAIADGKLTITGVAAGNTIVRLTVSATGEASSVRTIAVTVKSA